MPESAGICPGFCCRLCCWLKTALPFLCTAPAAIPQAGCTLKTCWGIWVLNAQASISDAKQQLEQQHFSYLSLEHFCPKLHEIIELRPILGLRSPVHTLVRLLNPFNAEYSIQGIFHPGYRPVHQQAAALLNQPHMSVLKGEGGETERNPDMECLVQSVHNGELSDENWPALFTRRHVKPELLEPEQLALIWQGKVEDEFAEASIIGTAAIALKLLGKADTQEQAQQLATDYWLGRDKQKYAGTNTEHQIKPLQLVVE